MARKESVERANSIAGGFVTAKKNVVIQYGGTERTTDGIMQRVKRDLDGKGIMDAEIEEVDVYIKPDEQAVYYVVNKQIEGSVSF